MINWIKKLFEDPNGIPDEARVSAMLLVLGYVGMGAWSIVMEHRPMDFQQYGVGIGAMAAGIGGWFWGRKDN